jgi:DNA-binding MarR family transcriptional regulator
VSGRDVGPSSDEGEEVDRGRTRRRPLALGGALRRAWVAYQLRLDRHLAAAGFADRGFHDGRVLRLCAQSEEVTASQLGRELGITRQGAGKLVAALRDRGYVTLRSSASDRREKVVSLTPRAHDYLAAQRSASRQIERDLRRQIGSEAFESLLLLLDALGGDDQPRMRDYFQRTLRVSYVSEGD